jgi:hypothetical protein
VRITIAPVSGHHLRRPSNKRDRRYRLLKKI